MPGRPSRELFESSLVEKIEDSLGGTALVLDVAQPALQLEWVAQYLLFVRKVAFFLKRVVGVNWKMRAGKLYRDEKLRAEDRS